MKTFKELIKESVKAVKEEEKKVDKPWKVLNKETDKVVRSFETAGEAEKFISNSSEGNKKYYKDYKKADGKTVGESLVKEDETNGALINNIKSAYNKFYDLIMKSNLSNADSSDKRKYLDLSKQIDKNYVDMIDILKKI